MRAWRPPPKLSVSEWADAERVLSPESAAEPGRWNTDRNPIARGVMDSIHEDGVREIIIMSSSQLLKTEVLLNAIGYFARLDPCPILLLQPTVEMAEGFSKERLAPMIRDTPTLTTLFADPKSRNSNNTVRKKLYPGGYVQMEGANSPVGLAMRAIRLLLCDEVDRYPPSAGREGDPVSIAMARMETFFNSLIIMTSSPTEKGVSRIEQAYESSDQRKCFVTCVHCRKEQVLTWAHVKWPKGEPHNAQLHCEQCDTAWPEAARHAMLARHQWKPTAVSQKPGRIGFHGSKLYSPWTQPRQLAVEFMDRKNDTEQLKTFVNTALGEAWEQPGETLTPAPLYGRREVYPHPIPDGQIVTAAVDVQDDRLEVELASWGEGEEVWGIAYRRFMGEPTKTEVWDRLDAYLRMARYFADGRPADVALACIDSGFLRDQVYEFCRRAPRFYIPTKGSSVRDHALADFPRTRNRHGVYLTTVGTHQGKDLLLRRLSLNTPGPGYCHWPQSEDYNLEYFEQLTAETRVKRYSHGHPQIVWEKRRPRNEALDVRILGYVAIRLLQAHGYVSLQHAPAHETHAQKSL